MTWAADRRLDYIDWCLALRGEVQRADISGVFEVSESQASQDINAFIAAYPAAIRYDKSRKRYVPARNAYRAQRGMDNPNVRRAISLLAAEGHPMGWSQP